MRRLDEDARCGRAYQRQPNRGTPPAGSSPRSRSTRAPSAAAIAPWCSPGGPTQHFAEVKTITIHASAPDDRAGQGRGRARRPEQTSTACTAVTKASRTVRPTSSAWPRSHPASRCSASFGMPRLEAHVARLTRYLLDELAALRHSNGAPLVRVYGPQGPRDPRDPRDPRGNLDRGGTVAFNVCDARGADSVHGRRGARPQLRSCAARRLHLQPRGQTSRLRQVMKSTPALPQNWRWPVSSAAMVRSQHSVVRSARHPTRTREYK